MVTYLVTMQVTTLKPSFLLRFTLPAYKGVDGLVRIASTKECNLFFA